MNNEPTTERNPGITGLLVEAVKRSLVDREPLLLLSLLYAFLTLIVVWPVWAQYQFLWQIPFEFPIEMPPELQDGLWGLGLALVLTQVIWCGVMVTWARIVGQIPGKYSSRQAAAVTGGVGPLARRTLTGYWHFLEFIGLSMLAAMIVIMVFGRAFAIDPAAPANAVQIIGIAIIVAAVMAASLTFAVAFGIALYESAQDRGRRLVKVWRALAGQRLKVALSLIVVLYLPSLVLSPFIVIIFTGFGLSTEGDTLGSLAFFILSATVWGIASCVWITFSGLLSARLNAPQAGDNVDVDV